MKDNFIWPGVILLGLAMCALVSTVAAASYRHFEWLPATVVITALGITAGVRWLVVENRRVRCIDAQWDAQKESPGWGELAGDDNSSAP